MRKEKFKRIIDWLGVAAVGIIVGLSIQFVIAWTEPNVGPPGGNVGAPINTNSLSQTKTGNLTVTKDFFANKIGAVMATLTGFLTLSPTNIPKLPTNGTIYYDAGMNKFRCYQNDAWMDCMGGGGGSSDHGIKYFYDSGGIGRVSGIEAKLICDLYWPGSTVANCTHIGLLPYVGDLRNSYPRGRCAQPNGNATSNGTCLIQPYVIRNNAISNCMGWTSDYAGCWSGFYSINDPKEWSNSGCQEDSAAGVWCEK